MPRPGVDVEITDAAPVGGVPLDTGQGFQVGLAQRGPVNVPVMLRSTRTYERAFGPRVGGAVAHDSVRAFFTEGGAVLYFLRLAGDGAHVAEVELGPLKVSASSPGTWGNAVTVGLEADTGPLGDALSKLAAANKPRRSRANGNGNGNGAAGPLVRVVVREDGNVVERSPLVDTAEAAMGWASASSAYLSLDADDPTATLEVTEAVSLAGGADDTNITPAVVDRTLAYFDAGYGPGQVAYPGATDPAIHYAILAHVARYRRCALLDLNDSDVLTVAADVLGLYGHDGARFGQALAPRLQYPGPNPATTILVPFSAIQMGVIARRDRATGNPNESAAGVDAFTAARGLNLQFTDDEREELNELGVTLARQRGRPAVTMTYGSRTCAGPDEPNWKWFGGSRVVMAITHESDAGAEQFVHKQIDPQGRLFIALNSVLTAICDRYFALGALYGETAEEAYQVDTSDAVNTPETIANGEIHAVIRLATSPPGEWVLIEIQKQTTSLVAA
jgi:phage tail sheath protein FI